MKGAFSIDSKLYRIVDKAMSLVKLNLIFILLSLPVITIGAAGCALYDTAMKIAENEEGYIFKNFLRVFCGKWKQTLKLWLPLLLAGIGLCLNLFFWTHQEGHIPEIMIGAVLMLMVFWFFLVTYTFALAAKTETSPRVTLRNAAFLAVKHLPKSLYMLLWTGIFLIAGWMWTPVMFLEFLAGAGALAVIHGKVLGKVFETESVEI